MTIKSVTMLRAPAPVLAAALTVLLIAAVTSYGAVYFTLIYQNPPVSAGRLAFVTFFLALKATMVVAAAGLLVGRRLAWQLLLGYALVWELGFAVVKFIVWHETAALGFGAVALLVLTPLLAAPATRRHINARNVTRGQKRVRADEASPSVAANKSNAVRIAGTGTLLVTISLGSILIATGSPAPVGAALATRSAVTAICGPSSRAGVARSSTVQGCALAAACPKLVVHVKRLQEC